jgi:metal-responsive CopG/Arc/MetJ family transcriptional regulator
MRRFTVSIPNELKEKLDKLPEINWPEVAKEAVVEKLSKLKKFEKLDNGGRL